MTGLILLVLLAPAGEAAALDAPALLETAVSGGSITRLEAIRSRLEQEADGPAVCYTLAYTDWRIANLLDSNKQRKKVLKRAEAEIDRCLEERPEDAEMHALRGSIIGGQIHGMLKGMRLGPKSSKALEKGFSLAPENPRVALLRGVGFYRTPKSFGGGDAKAEQELRRAWTLFQDEDDDTPWPDWGRIDVLAWLGQLAAKRGETAEARKLYEQALQIDPGNRWIRAELLPALSGD